MLPRKPTNHICQSAGFTLIELVITIVILGFSSMILLPFFNSISHSPDPLIRVRAVNLGQSLMDEILAKKWDNNTPAGGGPLTTAESARVPGAPAATPAVSLGPEAGESRQIFNDVDDYNGYAETTGVFHDQDNNSFTLTGYQRIVQVRYISSTTASIDHNTTGLSSTSDSKLIVVTVTSSTGEKFYFTAVRCNL